MALLIVVIVVLFVKTLFSLQILIVVLLPGLVQKLKTVLANLQALPREVYFVERKTIENRNIVQFELVSSFDLFGVSAPKKLVTREDFAGVGTFVNF